MKQHNPKENKLLSGKPQLKSVLKKVGVRRGHQVLFHAAFRKIHLAFPGLNISDLIQSVQQILTPAGSLMMPAFSYCFKKKTGISKIFDPNLTPGEVGAVSEFFRLMPDTVRTSSPTHSFVLWGKVNQEIDRLTSPSSPLGAKSVLEWLTHQTSGYILGMGIDFSAVSYGHYLEVQASLPWVDIFPWDHLGIEKKGISVLGEQSLIEVPGCSRSFTNFEKYLVQNKLLKSFNYQDLLIYYIPVRELYHSGMVYYKHQPWDLLCEPGVCQACDYRRKMVLTSDS